MFEPERRCNTLTISTPGLANAEGQQRRTGEQLARWGYSSQRDSFLELGTFTNQLQRTRDGWFVGCNLAFDDKVRSETDFDYSEPSSSPTAQHRRWTQLSGSAKKVDIGTAKSSSRRPLRCLTEFEGPSMLTLRSCRSRPAGLPEIQWGAFYPGGSFDAEKITTSSLAKEGKMLARWGKPCGGSFDSKSFLKEHKNTRGRYRF